MSFARTGSRVETRTQTPAFFLVIDPFYGTKSRFQEYFKAVPVSALILCRRARETVLVPVSLEFLQRAEMRGASEHLQIHALSLAKTGEHSCSLLNPTADHFFTSMGMERS